ncbi:MAG: queuosine precursor transporter [Opitutales bacterium]
MPSREKKFFIMVTVFLGCIGILNVISAKLWLFPFFNKEFAFSAGIIAYAFTFPVTDVVGEVFGRERANFVVWMGFLANAMVLLLSQIAVALPPATAIYPHQEAFATVLGAVPVIVFASLSAYLLAQLHDVWAFHFWKRMTRGRHLWLRNNLSTMSSQLIDSVIFNFIAFWLFAEEKMGPGAFVGMTTGYWLFKVGIAILDTPLVYLLVRWLTGRWRLPPEAEQDRPPIA